MPRAIELAVQDAAAASDGTPLARTRPDPAGRRCFL